MPFRVLTLIILLALASPAAAGDAKCIWDHLPGAARDAYLYAGLKDEATNPMDHFTGAQIGVALTACGVSDAALTSAGHAFSGYTRQLIAESRLEILTNVGAKQLDAAWATIDPALIAALAKDVAEGADHGAGLKVWRALTDLLSPAASDAAALRGELVGYMSSRATRQANEALY